MSLPRLPFAAAETAVLRAWEESVRASSPAPARVPEAAGEAPRGSRRRRLWELPPKCHCPLVGVCFGVGELRALMAKHRAFPRETSDYALHTTAVGACESRDGLSEVLQKILERRYALNVRRFAAARDGESLGRLWRQTLATGSGIPGALWAAWTHPACNKPLEQEIYADIHMFQHQVGGENRADLGELKTLREENEGLRNDALALRENCEVRLRERLRELSAAGAELTRLRAELAGSEAAAACCLGQLERLRESLPDLRKRQGLLRRADDAENRAAALTARLGELERENERLRRALAATPAGAPSASPPPSANAEEMPAGLSGKCVLCVGGRAGAVDVYRDLVESRGGRFLHHDGGLEESLHRIDTALAAADLVICQAGCISHNAYWRVKEQCKRSGKRCVFVRSPGVSSFARSIAVAAAPAESLAGLAASTLSPLPGRAPENPG